MAPVRSACGVEVTSKEEVTSTGELFVEPSAHASALV